jgi:hypothetical protein
VGFIFHPLDSGAVGLRKYAQRLASKLPGQRGTAHSTQDGYILRAVGDGVTVVVTAIPVAVTLAGAYMGMENTGNYLPGSAVLEQLGVGFVSISGPKLRAAVLSGVATDGTFGVYEDFMRYCASGRVQVGSVTQQWPLVDFTTDPDDGWIRSLPAYLIEGQSRLISSGAVDGDPWTTAPLVHETALLTLLTPLYRDEYFTPTSSIAAAVEAAVTLLRCNASTRLIKTSDIAPDYPPAIKNDLQADPRPRLAGLAGVGVVEFGWDALGAEVAPLIDDLDPSPSAGNISLNEGFIEPLGATEWGAANGVIAVRVVNRNWDQRLVFLRYQLTQADSDISGAVVWRSTVAGHLRWGTTAGLAQQNTGGMWATRSGRGVGDGTPEQPDSLIALSVDMDNIDTNIAATAGVWTTRLYTVDVTTGGVSTNTLSVFDCNSADQGGSLLRSDYFFAKGVTLGVGAEARPALVCVRRNVPYHLPSTVRLPVAFDRSHADDISVVVIKHDGTIVVVDVGTNFIATYNPSNDYDNLSDYDRVVVDGRYRLLGFQYLRGGQITAGAAQYGHPICEFAAGYLAILVTYREEFTAEGWPTRVVVCNAVTGALVFEGADIALPAIKAGAFRGLSCVQQGRVALVDDVEAVVDPGVLLISMAYPTSSGNQSSSGCYSTTDLGVTLVLAVGSGLPVGAAMHYLGNPLKPAKIGVAP